jgi:hypothetical protein
VSQTGVTVDERRAARVQQQAIASISPDRACGIQLGPQVRALSLAMPARTRHARCPRYLPERNRPIKH